MNSLNLLVSDLKFVTMLRKDVCSPIMGLYSPKCHRLAGIGIPNNPTSDNRLRCIIGIPISIGRCLHSEWRPWSHDSMPHNEPLARYVKLPVVHVPGMPGTFSPPPRVSNIDTHHGACVMHMPWCMPISLTSVFLSSQWRRKRSRHSGCTRTQQLYVSGPYSHHSILLNVHSGLSWKAKWIFNLHH